MKQQPEVILGAVVGAIVGAAAGYLFFTDRGRVLRDRMEPAIGDARREFTRAQGTFLTAAALALDGLRMLEDFSHGGAPSHPTPPVSH